MLVIRERSLIIMNRSAKMIFRRLVLVVPWWCIKYIWSTRDKICVDAHRKGYTTSLKLSPCTSWLLCGKCIPPGTCWRLTLLVCGMVCPSCMSGPWLVWLMWSTWLIKTCEVKMSWPRGCRVSASVIGPGSSTTNACWGTSANVSSAVQKSISLHKIYS